MQKAKLRSGEFQGCVSCEQGSPRAKEETDGGHSGKTNMMMHWAGRQTAPGHPAHHFLTGEGHTPATNQTGDRWVPEAPEL